MYKKILILIFSLSLMGCSNPFNYCEDFYQQELLNSNNNYEAVYFIADCGATATTRTFVQIKNIQSNNSENILIVREPYNSKIKLSWPEDEKLKIDFNGELKYVINFQPQFENITAELYKDNKLVSSEELKEAQAIREKEDAKFRPEAKKVLE